jgi:hypothetical protein
MKLSSVGDWRTYGVSIFDRDRLCHWVKRSRNSWQKEAYRHIEEKKTDST